MEEYWAGVGHNLRMSYGKGMALLWVVIHRVYQTNYKGFEIMRIINIQLKKL